jgi:hypothetical protein
MSEHVDTKQREADVGEPIAQNVEVYIYLYYLKFTSTQADPVETRAYFCSADGDTSNQAQIDGFVRTFAVNAHMNDIHPRSIGPNLDAMPRYRKGIIAIVVDVPGQTPEDGELTFEGRFNGAGAWRIPTHTLSLPPRPIGVAVSDGHGGTREIIAFYSYNGLNEPLDMSDLDKGEFEQFLFELKFPGALTGFPYQDSGGTNMGPPTGPPYFTDL